MRTRRAHHIFSTGEKVSLVDFLAAEVRRARRGKQRGAFEPIIALTEVELRRRRARSRPNGSSPSHLEGRGGIDTLPENTTSIEEGYWSGPDALQHSAMTVERGILRSNFVQNLFVAPSRRALFCPIQGAGSDSIMKFLEKVEGDGRFGYLQPLSSYSIRDRERFLNSKDIFRFVFVRHPFYRATAMYLRGTSSGALDSEAYRQFMGLVRGRPLNENEHELQRLSMVFYLTFLSRQNPGSLDDQFKSQVDHCGIGTIDYNKVGHMESFAKDISLVAKGLGLADGVEKPSASTAFAYDGVPQANISSTALQLFASSKHRTKASKLYAIDLSTLGYSPTQPPTISESPDLLAHTTLL